MLPPFVARDAGEAADMGIGLVPIGQGWMRRQVEPALQGQQGGLLPQQDMPAPPDGRAWLG